MEPMDIVGKTKEDASLPKGFFFLCDLWAFLLLIVLFAVFLFLGGGEVDFECVNVNYHANKQQLFLVYLDWI